MSASLSLDDRSGILELLSHIAWRLDAGRSREFAALFTADGHIERVDRRGGVRRWGEAGDTLSAFVGDVRDGVSVEDRQTWTSDVLFSPVSADEVVVSSTSLRIGSAGGGMSNVVLGDERVTDTVVRTPEGWRLRSRSVRPLGADDTDPTGAFAAVDLSDDAPPGDRIEIEALFADYAWALDTADIEGVLELFSDDAVMQDPFGRFTGSGPEGVRRFFEGLFARPEFAGRIHWVSQLRLTPVGDDYRVDSYALVPAAFPNGAVNLHLLAFYRDVVRKQRGRWVFVERLVGPRWPEEDAPSSSNVLRP